jgi:hypothetical protein
LIRSRVRCAGYATHKRENKKDKYYLEDLNTDRRVNIKMDIKEIGLDGVDCIETSRGLL